MRDMHTVCELHSFRRAADDAGLDAEEISELVTLLAENPLLGDEIQGTGGCRKLRFRRKGGGKSGGYRVITFYSGVMMPIFLLTVFSKGEKANLTQSEKASLKVLTTTIVKTWHEKFATSQTGAKP